MSSNAPDTAAPVFSIEKIYVKDLSLEIPHAPQVFLNREQPEVQIELHTAARSLDEGVYEVSVSVTLTARASEKTLFLVEANQAGIFQLRNVADEEVDPILSIACPNMLFPYVRETVSDVVNRAGFPPVYLAPVNFEAIYHQRRAEMEAQAASSGQEVSVQ
ncbi:MAG: SecB [Pseudomonadota bacterium]|jgi:preprotein translocase subunit SecB